MSDSCDVSFIVLIVILIAIAIILIIYFIRCSFKREPIIIYHNLNEAKSRIKRNEALIYETKVPFVNKYWCIKVYTKDGDKNINIVNDISNGDYPNTDVDDKLYIVITPNKYVYDMIVRKNKKAEYIFRPIFVNETENEYYIESNFYECCSEEYKVKRVEIKKSPFIKPVSLETIKINDNLSNKEFYLVKDFEKSALKILKMNGHESKQSVSVKLKENDITSNITSFTTEVLDNVTVGIVAIDHVMTKKCFRSEIKLNDESIITGEINNRLSNNDSEVIVRFIVKEIKNSMITENLYIDSETKLAPNPLTILPMKIYII